MTISVYGDGKTTKYKSVYVIVNSNGYTCSEPIYVTSCENDAYRYTQKNGGIAFHMPIKNEVIESF